MKEERTSLIVLAAAAQLIECLLQEGDELGRLLWVKGDGTHVPLAFPGDVAGLADLDETGVGDIDANAVSGREIPGAHVKMTLCLNFRDGKLSSYSAAASGLKSPFYTGRLLPQSPVTSDAGGAA